MKDWALMETYKLATEVAQENPDTIVFRAAEQLVYDQHGRWSAPVQLKWQRLEDGTFDLLCRTVDLASLTREPS
jgi:hypothetical protein